MLERFCSISVLNLELSINHDMRHRQTARKLWKGMRTINGIVENLRMSGSNRHVLPCPPKFGFMTRDAVVFDVIMQGLSSVRSICLYRKRNLFLDGRESRSCNADTILYRSAQCQNYHVESVTRGLKYSLSAPRNEAGCRSRSPDLIDLH